MMITLQSLSNFNPLPPRGGRHFLPLTSDTNCKISIHSLREEGDLCLEKVLYNDFRISIHSLREEGDICTRPSGKILILFQSTPSARRETDEQMILLTKFAKFQSTPSARRETLFATILDYHYVISIHSLREEGDRIILLLYSTFQTLFQSTPSARRETLNAYTVRYTVLFQSTPSARRETTI